jgi:PAS domain S-box-containing protein
VPVLSGAAQAADSAAGGAPVLDGVTIVAALCFVLTPFLIFGTAYFRSKFRDAAARAVDLEARLEREQALLDSAPQAIVCWDTGTGDQKVSESAARMIGCDQADVLNGARIAEIVSDDNRAAISAAINDLIATANPSTKLYRVRPSGATRCAAVQSAKGNPATLPFSGYVTTALPLLKPPTRSALATVIASCWILSPFLSGGVYGRSTWIM